MNVTRHVLIRGRVQGVGFRAFVEYAALDRGLEGWVRNRRDGSVEAVFTGPAATVAQMVNVCRRGPPGARVDVLDEREGSSADLKSRRAGELFSVLPSV
jgi:acylphosphatase